MATNQYAAGNIVQYSNTGSAITSGSPVVIGNRVGIAVADIAATTGVGAVAIAGVFSVTKTSGHAWTQGQEIYYDAAAAAFTALPNEDCIYAGTAYLAAASGDTSGYVNLDHGAPTAKRFKAFTADETLTRAQVGMVCSNLGATGAVTLTLPQDAIKGDYFHFVVQTAQQLRIDPGAAGAIYIGGAKQTDDKYIWADDEGESVMLVCDGNGDWVAMHLNGTWTTQT